MHEYLEKLENAERKCPECRAVLQISLETLNDHQAPPALRSLIGDLEARCPNDGCNLKIRLSDLDNHKNKCEHRTQRSEKPIKSWKVCAKAHKGEFYRAEWKEGKVIKILVNAPEEVRAIQIVNLVQVRCPFEPKS